jgi:hypothetical protein
MIFANAIASLARRWHLGRVLYHTYHAPLGALQKWRREGPANLWLSRRGRLQMERAARRLPPVGAAVGDDALEVHFLSGRKFWYQTCFCAYSLLRHSPVPLRPVVHDDGSLDDACAGQIRRVLPGARLVTAEESAKRVEAALPADRYPALRERLKNFPHLRKLTDIHAGRSGWRLFLDSDMLFFRAPTFLLDWLRSPGPPCYMLDVASYYGYSSDLMNRLAGAPVPERVNSGIFGCRSDDVDWDRLEVWCREMIAAEGAHYLQEQAVTAMLLAGRDSIAIPAEDYVALPSRAEAERPAAVLHHYVGASKAWYFRFGWRSAIEATQRNGA